MPAFVPPPRFRPPEPRTPLPQYRGDFPSLLALLRKALSKTGEDIPVSASDATTIAQAILALAAKAPDPTEGNLAALDAQGNPVDSGTKPSDFQSKLTFDTTPTAGSQNPVTSGGIKSAIDAATPEDYAEVKAQVQTNTGVITDVQRDVADVKAKIPAHATAQNQLADKEFVNSSIATNTATFRGTYNLVTDLQLPLDATHEQVAAAVKVKLGQADYDGSDYVFVQIPQDLEHTDAMKQVDRYKCVETGADPVVKNWEYEWTLNNSSFTAEQWAAINSGITSGLVAKLGALPTAEALAAALAGKASTADVTLTPVYSDWTILRDGVDVTAQVQQPIWTGDGDFGYQNAWFISDSRLSGEEGAGFIVRDVSPNDVALTFVGFVPPDYDTQIHYTATRTLIGYTLGDQTDKPLQPKGDYAPATGIQKSALAQDVQASLDKADTALQTAPVASVNGKTGAVTLSASDVGALGNSGNQTLNGTLSLNSNNGSIRTPVIRIAYNTPDSPASNDWIIDRDAAGDLEIRVPTDYGSYTTFWLNGRKGDSAIALLSDLAGLAPLASPAFTGTPTAPTPASGDNSTKVATTAFVQGAIGGITPGPDNTKLDSTSAAPAFSTSSTYAVGEHVTYNGKLYRCTTAVTVAGVWDASKWTADTMTDPDAVLDITSQNQLRVVAKDGTLLWAQGYDLASTSSATLACDAVNNFTFADGATTQAFALPTAPTGKVGDFILDIDNSANTGAATISFTDIANNTASVVIPKGENLNDMFSFAAGEMAELYFTKTTFTVNNLPTWHIVKQVVENGGAQS